MKSFIIAMLITVILILGSIIYTSHIDKVSDTLTQENLSAIHHLRNDDFANALLCINNISSYISTKKPLLATTLDHTELDRIESTVAEMYEFTVNKNKTDALAKASALNIHLEHMPKNYKLKIENIL